MNPMLVMIISALVLIAIVIGVSLSFSKVMKASAQGLNDKQAGKVMDETQYSTKVMKQAYRSGYLAQEVLDDEGKEKIEQLTNNRTVNNKKHKDV